MDIYETLHNEHQEVAKLFTSIEHTSNTAVKTRGKLFDQLKTALDMHSRAEEKVFYPVLNRHKESHFQSMEAVEEHHMVDLILKELASAPKNNDAWMAKLEVLKEAVLHHVDQEEQELFQKAKMFMDERQADELARKFLDEKKHLH